MQFRLEAQGNHVITVPDEKLEDIKDRHSVAMSYLGGWEGTALQLPFAPLSDRQLARMKDTEPGSYASLADRTTQLLTRHNVGFVALISSEAPIVTQIDLIANDQLAQGNVSEAV